MFLKKRKTKTTWLHEWVAAQYLGLSIDQLRDMMLVYTNVDFHKGEYCLEDLDEWLSHVWQPYDMPDKDLCTNLGMPTEYFHMVRRIGPDFIKNKQGLPSRVGD